MSTAPGAVGGLLPDVEDDQFVGGVIGAFGTSAMARRPLAVRVEQCRRLRVRFGAARDWWVTPNPILCVSSDPALEWSYTFHRSGCSRAAAVELRGRRMDVVTDVGPIGHAG
jgi:hypothetical protein